MKQITLPSYAKVNLYLKVLKRLPIGYHKIQTIFQSINLKDKITIAVNEKKNIEVSSDNKDVPADASNLAYQAARMLLDKHNLKFGLNIHINKNIPVAAGLGGGSSNAASCLLGLNRLLNIGLSRKQIVNLASSLGSDVPFFVLENGCALGQGRGHIVKKLKKIPKFWFILVCPNIKIPAKWAYSRYKLNLTKKKPSVKMCIRTLKKGNLDEISSVLYNDLEEAIQKKYKEVETIKNELNRIGVRATLTSGSGPCVFGMLNSREEAIEAKESLKGNRDRWAIYVSSSR